MVGSINRVLCISLFISGLAISSKAKSFDCKMLHEMLAKKELNRFLHLDVNDSSFTILDAEKYLKEGTCQSFEGREVLIVRDKVVSKATRRRPLTISINKLTEKNGYYIVDFTYDYEGVIGKLTYDRSGIIKEILVWEH
jgi:hypothetical protein